MRMQGNDLLWEMQMASPFVSTDPGIVLKSHYVLHLTVGTKWRMQGIKRAVPKLPPKRQILKMFSFSLRSGLSN